MLGIMLVCLAAILWGTTGVASQLMSEGDVLDPAISGFARMTFGAAALLAAAEAARLPWSLGRQPLGLLALFGIAGAVFQCCLFAAFQRVGVTVTVAVTVCAPVLLVASGAAFWAREWPERAVVAAIALAGAGVLLALLAYDANGFARLDRTGLVLLLVASLAYTLVAASARELARRVHPLRATGLGLGITALVLALYAGAHPGFALGEMLVLPARDIGLLAYTGIVATGIAYLCFSTGLGLSRTAAGGMAATMIEPAVAAMLAALLLGEWLAGPQMLGCSLMLGGTLVLFAAEAAKRRRLADGLAAT